MALLLPFHTILQETPMSHARTLRRRIVLAAAAVLAIAPILSNVAWASDWTPTRPIKLVVPSTPGGGADITGRLFGEKLSAALGQPVVVENKGGAGGLQGTDSVAKSAPDGYTLLLGSDYAFTVYPQLRKPPYDPVKDFEPIGLIENLPLVLTVNPQRVPATNMKELLALVKANPGKYSIASSGVGASNHLAAEYLKHQAGLDLLHVPYKGAAEATLAVLSGQTDMVFNSPATLLPHFQTGKLKAMGISTASRSHILPDLPTLMESGVSSYDIGIWFGFFFPANTPKPIVDRVNAELQTILAMPDVRKKIFDMGYTPAGGKPELLTDRVKADSSKFGKLIRDANIKLD
jgi:tripartite-type tricarboxylate transporter receptor subunit TctC